MLFQTHYRTEHLRQRRKEYLYCSCCSKYSRNTRMNNWRRLWKIPEHEFKNCKPIELTNHTFLSSTQLTWFSDTIGPPVNREIFALKMEVLLLNPKRVNFGVVSSLPCYKTYGMRLPIVSVFVEWLEIELSLEKNTNFSIVNVCFTSKYIYNVQDAF